MKLKAFIFILLTATLVENASPKRHSRKNGEPLEEWQQIALGKIQVMAREGGLSGEEWRSITKYNKDMCYTKDCLEAALEIVSAVNFTVDPCQPKDWLKFACERRVNTHDNLNQLESLQQTMLKQIKQLLEETTGAHDDDLLFKEAQTYYHQCVNKGEKDDEDVKEILKTMEERYGDWPIFSHGKPGKRFRWMDMIAYQNRFHKKGFRPLLFQVVPDLQNIILQRGQLSFPSVEDITTVIDIMQKHGGFEVPARTEDILQMKEFIEKFAYVGGAAFEGWELMSIKHLQETTDGELEHLNSTIHINWLRFFKRVFQGSELVIKDTTPVMVQENPIFEIITILSKLIPEGRVSLANSLHFHLNTVLLQETTNLLDDVNPFKCLEENGGRDLVCIGRTTEIFGYSLGQTYLNTFYDDKRTTPALKNMMAYIKQGYLDVIDNTNWASDTTKAMLKRKVNKMKTHCTKPNDMRHDPEFLEKFYDGFVGSQDKRSSYPLNYLNITDWEWVKKASWAEKFTRRKDYRDMYEIKWNAWLGEANGQYNKGMNEARIEGGIPQSPLFGVSKPGFINFGGLGTVMAHEIGHSFDTEGVLFDDNGQYTPNFWDDASRERYLKWVEKVKEDATKARNELTGGSTGHLGAERSVKEDIADVVGISLCFQAYNDYLKGLESKGKKEMMLPGLGSYTPQQLFYMKYANMWCNKKPVQEQYRDLLGVHSPGNIRATLPLKRSKEFAETFGCPVPEGAYTMG